jgi:hypothetical protein
MISFVFSSWIINEFHKHYEEIYEPKAEFHQDVFTDQDNSHLLHYNVTVVKGINCLNVQPCISYRD